MFTTPEMDAIFTPAAHIRQMLAFEAALARAEAAAGVIPATAAEPIAAACQQEFDSAAIDAEATVAGTPAIPLVRQLRARVAGGAADYVHWGATSQDAIDSAAIPASTNVRMICPLRAAGLAKQIGGGYRLFRCTLPR